MNGLSEAINDRFLGGGQSSAAGQLVTPLYDAYVKASYNSTEQALFPGFFHGKCQDKVTGIEPKGCPDPDCPVVCGTPGSMVHYYPILATLAYNITRDTLATVAFRTSGPTFQSINSSLLSLYHRAHRQHRSIAPATTAFSRHHRYHRLSKPKRSDAPVGLTDAEVTSQLKSLLVEFAAGAYLSGACKVTGGGTMGNPVVRVGRGKEPDTYVMAKDVGQCSWAMSMIPYILSFP